MACLISWEDCAISLVLMYDASHVYSWHPCTVPTPQASAICCKAYVFTHGGRHTQPDLAAGLSDCQGHTCRCDPASRRSWLAPVPHQIGDTTQTNTVHVSHSPRACFGVCPTCYTLPCLQSMILGISAPGLEPDGCPCPQGTSVAGSARLE